MDIDNILREKLTLTDCFERECCNDVHNLVYAFDLNKYKDKTVLRCKHCNAVHHRLYAVRPAM